MSKSTKKRRAGKAPAKSKASRGARSLLAWLAKHGRGSQSRLAADAGIVQPSISEFAHGRRVPSIEQGAQLEDLTGIRIRHWVESG